MAALISGSITKEMDIVKKNPHLIEKRSCSHERVSSARLIFLCTISGAGEAGYRLADTLLRFSRKMAPGEPSLGGLETCSFKGLQAN